MNAERTNNTAKAFLIASKRADEMRVIDGNKFERVIVPATVCAAFSVEIGMKAIILAEGKKAYGHHLDSLFAELSPESQSQITSAITLSDYQKREGVTPTFGDAITKIRGAFVDWRYIHEKEDWTEVDYSFLMQLAQAVQDVAAKVIK
jgi:hypothetical protein